MVFQMKNLKILSFTLPFSLILFLGLTMPGFSETEIPKAKLPILTTSAGQSPDVTTVNIVLLWMLEWVWQEKSPFLAFM
jgi:hypothetical protein